MSTQPDPATGSTAVKLNVPKNHCPQERKSWVDFLWLMTKNIEKYENISYYIRQTI